MAESAELSQDRASTPVALADHNSYNKGDMKILSTLLYGRLGLVMPNPGSLPWFMFFFDRAVLNLSSDCRLRKSIKKMRVMVGHIESSVVISKHG